MEDLDETEDKVLEGDDELTKEIDEETADTSDNTKIIHDKWIPKVPNWVTITGSIVLLVVGLGIAFRKKIFKKWRKCGNRGKSGRKFQPGADQK